MIQRLQTVYLGLVGVAFLILAFLPVANFSAHDSELKFYLFKAILIKEGVELTVSGHFWLGILAALISALAVYAIFQFKNRKFQLKLTGGLFLLIGGFIVVEYFLQENLLKQYMVNASKNYLIGTYIPLLSLLFVFMAQRGIKKDEELVRSADRLR